MVDDEPETYRIPTSMTPDYWPSADEFRVALVLNGGAA